MDCIAGVSRVVLTGLLCAGLAGCASGGASAARLQPAIPSSVPSLGEVLAATRPEDWRIVDPESTLYMDLEAGRVVIELTPVFAPQHVANIKALAREGYFDGLAVLRAQDNYVVQWGDPDGTREIRTAAPVLPPEFTVPFGVAQPFTGLGGDGYAAETGFVEGLPAGRDREAGLAWLAHCYGMVGVGRDVAPDSGSGSQLYAVIGHAPRHLDRNITVVGRVLQGIELLSTLPRGSGALGFYEQAAERVPILAVRVAADVPPAERQLFEVLRTDTAAFAAVVRSRAFRVDEWFTHPVGYVELCNVPVPARPVQ